MKSCYRCKEIKQLTCFHANKVRRDGLSDLCKSCSKEVGKLYYQNNKGKQKQQAINLYSGREGRARYLLKRSKERAKLCGFEHNITIEDTTVPELCPYLNIKLTTQFGKGQLGTNASIDRIDNTKGYIKGNVQIVSRRANTMKSDASSEELISFAKAILDRT